MERFADNEFKRLKIGYDEHHIPIGGILMRHNKLTPEKIARIVVEQKGLGLPFGEVAILLGMIKEADLQRALSDQFGYLIANDINNTSLSNKLVVVHAPHSDEAENFRRLRTQLLHNWFNRQQHKKFLAVASSCRGDGRSFVASNLAVSFAQLGKRTLLIDANLRHPQLHELFNIANNVGLSSLLNRMVGPEAIHQVSAWRHLAVLPAGPTPPNPQELLSRWTFPELIKAVTTEFDIVLVDTPAYSQSAEVQTIAGEAASALIVVRPGHTRQKQYNEIVKSLYWTGAEIVGAVMNESHWPT